MKLASFSLALAALAFASAPQAKTKTPKPPKPVISIEAVSAPADFVSGGKVLVRVRADNGPFTLWLNGRDVSEALVGGSGDVGLVSGLKLGVNRIEVDQGRRRAVLKVVNHPLEGPIVSGPHAQPFICQTQDFKLPDGATLGPPLDKDCFAATHVNYLYKARGAAGLKPLTRTDQTPPDADTATTLSGATVPFVVRVETGVINRAIYQFAVLHNPATDGPIGPRNSPKGWARRLLAVHGTGCARGWYIQGAAMGVNPIDAQRLSQGFAVFTSTLNHPTNSCNAVVAGETTLMVRQHVIETLGAPLYTLTMGGSGGAYTSLQIADAFPGLFDGVLTSATFPDALAISLQSSDGRLLNHYFREVAQAESFTPAQQQAIGGYGAPIGLIANGNQAGRTDPVPNRKDADRYLSAVWNDAVPAALRYDPKTNPKGARPTVFDWAANVYGRDRKTGFARRPFDNTGVQYGLKALNDGVISKAQFIDLNARVGGYDNDTNYVAARSVGDPVAIANAYRSGLMLSGAGGLKDLPMLDFTGIYSDLRPSGDYHMKHHHFSVRERLKRWSGNADNMVMWSDGGRPEEGARAAAGNTAEEAFAAMDRWLTAAANDSKPGTRLEKTLRNRPDGLTDGCFDAAHKFIAEVQVTANDTACNRLYPVHSYPRGVAGGPASTDVIKCRLKRLDRRDYKVAFDRSEWAALNKAFPRGVCDWSKPGVGQQKVQPWTVW